MHTIDPKTGKQLRGFALLNAQQRREMASKGGASVPDDMRAFARDRLLAATAGRKGGENSRSGKGR